MNVMLFILNPESLILDLPPKNESSFMLDWKLRKGARLKGSRWCKMKVVER